MEVRFIVLCGVLLSLELANSSKILIIVGVNSPSHYNVFVPVIEELAKRKHEITVQAFQTLKRPFSNVKELKIPFKSVDVDKKRAINFVRLALVTGPIAQLKRFTPLLKKQCEDYNEVAESNSSNDLNDFVESSGDDGFIIFGLGSNMKSEYLSPDELQAIMSAFSRLKQKVIWKFETELENKPKNVKITDWMPQQDLLGHPKARLFITHSGLLSLQESVYHGVPVIGIPFFGDQRGNIMRMKELGIGECLDFLNLTADGFYELISKVLNDKRYYENMKTYFVIFQDQLDRPVERAVYWIEYVIRHDGAHHFRSAGEDLNFFQYFLLDVLGFIVLGLVISIGIVVYVINLILSKFRGKTPRKNETIKKTN